MGRFIFLGIVFLILLSVEFLCFRSLNRVISIKWKLISSLIYWITTGLAYGVVLYSIIKYPEFQLRREYSLMSFSFGLVLILLIPKLVIALFYAVDFVALKTFVPKEFQNSRRRFIATIGWVLAAIPFLSIFWGMWKGKYSFRFEKHKIPISEGGETNPIYVVQISDAHLGSFPKDAPIPEIIDRINELNADLIVFTGDLVNTYAEEAEYWIPHFKKLSASLGKFSVFGNHDYGDYGTFTSEEEKAQNHVRLKEISAEMGFDLLLNENRLIQKGDREIQLIGIENWGLPPFPQYGKLDVAMEGLKPDVPSILLSHDPSHWDAEVLGKTNIPLALAGHTHGMQFGLRIGNWQWSPVKYRYPRWAGKYTEGNQTLYVNRGFGYLGFPGRVGMPPEITVLAV